MLATEAVISTPRATRYLTQLVEHIEHLRDGSHTHLGLRHDGPVVMSVERAATDATLTFTWGHCTLHANPDTLTLRLDASDDNQLRQLQSLITHRLHTISRRDDLTITWQPAVSVDPTAP